MARKTYNTTPMTVSTQQLEMSYANFASFKGINNNKNYVTVDQETFSEANNVYVDNDNQLSSRPKLVEDDSYHDIKNELPNVTESRLVNIVKVNGLVFYIIAVDHVVLLSHSYSYYARVYYNNQWEIILLFSPDVESVDELIETLGEVYITYSKDMYIFFAKSQFPIGRYWSYSQSRFVSVPDVALPYVPVTEIISGSARDSYDAMNVLTNEFITRYIFSSGTETDLSKIIGKDMRITVAGDTVTTTIKQYIEKAAMVERGNIGRTFIKVLYGSNGVSIGIDANYNIYFSVNDLDYTQITAPVTLTQYDDITLSEDGTTLFLLDASTRTLYYASMPSYSGDASSISFTNLSISFPIGYQCNNKFAMQTDMYSTSWSGAEGSSSFIIQPVAIGHALTSSKYVALFSNVVANFQSAIHSNGTDYDISGAANSSTYASLLITYFNGVVATYLLTGTVDSAASAGASAGISFIEVRDYVYIVLRSVKTYIAVLDATNSYRPFYYFSLTDNSLLIRGSTGICHQYFYEFDRNIHGNPITLSTVKIELAPSGETYLFDAYAFDVVTRNSQSESTLITYQCDLSGFIDNVTEDTYSEVYADKITMASGVSLDRTRQSFPLYITQSNSQVSVNSSTVNNVAIYNNEIFATDKYLYYKGSTLEYVGVYSTMSIVYYVDENGVKATQGTYAYQTADPEDVTIDYHQYLLSDGTISDDDADQELWSFVPSFDTTLLSLILSYQNKLYISQDVEEYKLYLPEDRIVTYEDDITNLVNFSTDAVGVFLEGNIYELTYTDAIEGTRYQYDYVSKLTKLQLGCKRGSDVMLTYDGSNVIVTNLKGMNALTYQDFKQTTDQAYTYLTENIITLYEAFAKVATSGIKLYQYKNWIFMYSSDINKMYLYDLRNSSWWQWTLNHQIDQLININDELYLRSGSDLFYFDSSFADYYDNNTEPIDWNFKSQKLHFDAPNNYKTVKSLTILASNDEEGSIVSKLKFYNYRNMMFEASDVVEYEVKQLTTFIKKVNFMKTNAFQFEISNYRDVEPCKFTTPNVAIKYRITEAVR